jgi:hypothetical protein
MSKIRDYVIILQYFNHLTNQYEQHFLYIFINYKQTTGTKVITYLSKGKKMGGDARIG